MAIIITCKSCKKRVPVGSTACPDCKSGSLIFTLDYWPDGRRGKRIRKPLDPDIVSTEDQAKAIEKALLDLKRVPGSPERGIADTDATVKSLFPKYLEYYELHRSPRTYADLTGVYNNHLERILGDKRIVELGPEHITIYQRLRKNEGDARRKKEPKAVSNRTVNKELQYLGGFLTWCRTDHRLKAEALVESGIRKLPYETPLPVILTKAETRRILAAMPTFWRTLFMCLYTLGLRWSGGVKLRKRNIDVAGKTVKLIQKGGKEKILPMTKDLCKAMKAICVGKKDDEYIFLNKSTGKPVSNARKVLQAACKEAKVTKRVTPHLFRHSFATHLLNAGVNLRLVQDFLGHAQVSTTEKYTHVSVDNLRDAGETINVSTNSR